MGAAIQKFKHRLSALTTSTEKRDFNSKYVVGHTLGSGSFGNILEALQIHTFQTVALKYIKKKEVESWLTIHGTEVPSEAVYLNFLEHDNIIEIVDLYEFKKNFVLVLERPLASLDLGQYISKYGPQKDNIASYIGYQLLSTTLYLQNSLIFHRDIKSENILVNYYNYSIKLIDFGSATQITEEDVYYGSYGTPAFAPPEWVAGDGYRSEPTTIWSIGVVLFEMLTGHLPFCNEDHLMRAKLFFPEFVSVDARWVLSRMMKKDESSRLTVQGTLELPYFGDFSNCSHSGLDESTYSKASAYMIYENLNCSNVVLSEI